MSILPAAVLAGLAVALAVPGGPSRIPQAWPVLLLALVAYVPGPLVAAASVLGAAGLGAYSLLRRRRRRAEHDAYAARIRDLCDALAADLAAGAAPSAALARLATRWPEASRVVEAERFGMDPSGAWDSLAAEARIESLALVGLAWRYAQHTGIGLGVAMRFVADGLRTQARLDRTVATEMSSARATARLVALLPLGVLAMGAGLGGNPWHFLFLTPPGVGLLAVGLGLVWVGLRWLEAIIEGVRP